MTKWLRPKLVLPSPVAGTNVLKKPEKETGRLRVKRSTLYNPKKPNENGKCGVFLYLPEY